MAKCARGVSAIRARYGQGSVGPAALVGPGGLEARGAATPTGDRGRASTLGGLTSTGNPSDRTGDQTNETDHPVRLAIVGCGFIGTVHSFAIRSFGHQGGLADAAVVATCDMDIERAQRMLEPTVRA